MKGGRGKVDGADAWTRTLSSSLCEEGERRSEDAGLRQVAEVLRRWEEDRTGQDSVITTVLKV